MSHSIFIPVYVLFMWAMWIMARLAYMKIKAHKAKEIRFSQFKLVTDMPERIQLTLNNLTNLYQMPVFFFVLAVFIFAKGMETPFYLGLSWTYVFLRIIHSMIHITTNNVNLRASTFFLSIIVLVWMYTAFLFDII
ncbi:MAG: hypothetical protein DRQ88_06570 [Epsilonproteobacteria bacterium]|nr:MAG: hypothetical protein DRQ89_04720 [Campylobacterota bacterium]RLA66461.1 MAG: hypothetical protein DRQ88_06570 [Campylobacterota bacterium]